MPSDSAEFDREVTRRRLEESDLDVELALVHTDDDPDDCYHDYEEINRLNVALGTLTTVEWAEEHGYQRCSECFGDEEASCPNCDNKSILEHHCEHCGYGLEGLGEAESDHEDSQTLFRTVMYGLLWIGVMLGLLGSVMLLIYAVIQMAETAGVVA